MIMRYFRDMGVDAHLLMYENDDEGNLSHFSPQADSWDVEKWQPYIHKTKISNQSKTINGSIRNFELPCSRRFLAKELCGYDRYIGSGIAPALFERLGWKLNVFFPYGIGIEMYGTVALMTARRTSWLRRIFLDRLRKFQAAGIRNTEYCLNAELSLTKDSFEEIGKDFLPVFLPCVYNGEQNPEHPPSGFEQISNEIRSAKFSIFSHARQLWVKKKGYTQTEWESETKNSDLLIRGFAEFLSANRSPECLLILLEYGEDVAASKALCSELGISKHVRWVPQTERKNLMYLLSLCDVGIGEFYVDQGCIWGGTGWEVLSAGKPLIQSFNFTKHGFESSFSVQCPPILHADNFNQVAEHLSQLFTNTKYCVDTGKASSDWFDLYAGVGLARKWAGFLGVDSEG